MLPLFIFFLGQDRTLFLSKRFCLWLWILSTKKIEERKREKKLITSDSLLLFIITAEILGER